MSRPSTDGRSAPLTTAPTTTPRAPEDTPALSARGIHKRFGSTTALAGVDFAVHAGEIVGLVGANGAGKSTLISILSGAVRADAGELAVRGAPVVFANPDDAAAAGVATVQQDVDAALVPELTVAENLVLDRLASGALGALPGRRRIRDAAAEVAGHGLRLDARVASLVTAQKQQLLIARALHRGARVLILDEPTAALSIAEQRELHARVRELAAAGTAVVYITHHLGEIAELCDRAVVLREGAVVAEHAAPVSLDALVTSMLGSVAAIGHRTRTASTRVALSARGVRTVAGAPPLDLELVEGEVLGITGLLGAGKTELLEQLAGVRPLVDGRLELGGAPYRPRRPSDAIRAGVGFVAEDRRTRSELGEWSVAQNLTLPDLRRYSRAGFVGRRSERAAARAEIDRLRIVASGADAGLRSLSGGNRQKVMVARWLAARSRLLVLDEPFRGVDLGARADIAALLRSGEVSAALVAASDPEEILEVADRVLVLVAGRIVAELRADETDSERLAVLMSSTSASITTTNAPTGTDTTGTDTTGTDTTGTDTTGTDTMSTDPMSTDPTGPTA